MGTFNTKHCCITLDTCDRDKQKSICICWPGLSKVCFASNADCFSFDSEFKISNFICNSVLHHPILYVQFLHNLFIRRLPRSNYLLFTVKTMEDPLSSLEALPVATECLASSIRGMSLSLLKYKGIENKKIRDVILCYLDSIASINIKHCLVNKFK